MASKCKGQLHVTSLMNIYPGYLSDNCVLSLSTTSLPDDNRKLVTGRTEDLTTTSVGAEAGKIHIITISVIVVSGTVTVLLVALMLVRYLSRKAVDTRRGKGNASFVRHKRFYYESRAL